MTEDLLKQRKDMLAALFQEKSYVPMKLKELAIFLDIPKSQRDELKEVLDILLREDRHIEKRKVRQSPGFCPDRSILRPCQGIRLCHH